MNVVLIGMRSCGKSNISRRLSHITKKQVISTDLMISYDNNGLSIPEILTNHNGDWRVFRDMEYEVVKKVALLDEVIIDAGGGLVVDLDDEGRELFSHRKMDLLKKNAFIIWLKGDIKRLVQKVKGDAGRPSLSDQLAAEEVMKLRLPFYQQSADWIVDIERKTRKQLVEEIVQKIP